MGGLANKVFMIFNKKEIVGDIDYLVIPKHQIIYVEEIAIYGKNKKKGFGTRGLWKLFEKYENNNINKIVGISTNSSIPFWKTLGAEISDVKENGDCFFSLCKYTLLLYIRNKGKKNE